MNEVKELVEELRNKKSRDNRELLDRSADMIEKLAKELCEKSGCHHKCHDTKDCVVEDEAKAIIGDNLPFALTNEGKVSEKVKQIEEMAKVIEEASCGYGVDGCYNCEFDGTEDFSCEIKGYEGCYCRKCVKEIEESEGE